MQPYEVEQVAYLVEKHLKESTTIPETAFRRSLTIVQHLKEESQRCPMDEEYINRLIDYLYSLLGSCIREEMSHADAREKDVFSTFEGLVKAVRSEKMTPIRILEIYEDVRNRYEEYVAGEDVEYPYAYFPGKITVHLPPIHGRADDREKFKGEFEPDYVDEGTVIATIDADGWPPTYILDRATVTAIRDLFAQMLFPDGNSALEFLEAQDF